MVLTPGKVSSSLPSLYLSGVWRVASNSLSEAYDQAILGIQLCRMEFGHLFYLLSEFLFSSLKILYILFLLLYFLILLLCASSFELLPVFYHKFGGWGIISSLRRSCLLPGRGVLLCKYRPGESTGPTPPHSSVAGNFSFPVGSSIQSPYLLIQKPALETVLLLIG